MRKIVFFICCIAFNSYAQVSSTSDAGANTLRDAIAKATNNQTITFSSNLASTTITLNSTLEIPVGKNLTIDGAGAPKLTISGNNLVRIFLLKSTSVNPTRLTLKNLVLSKGFTTEYGAAVKSEHQGIINIENCTFTQNNAQEGGSAVFSNFEGKCTILNCTFDANISIAKNTERGSTVMLWGPKAHTVQNSNFTNNKGINGAAINGLNSGLLVENCNFINNTTEDAVFDTGKPNDFLRGYGGAIYADRASAGPPNNDLGSIIVRKCKFESNIGQSDGGAMYLFTDATDNVLVEECYFNNNHAKLLSGQRGGGGGAIEQMNNSKNKGFVVRNTTFSNNTAAVNGGAIRADWADTKIENCTFYNNKALQTKSDGYSANGGGLVCYSMNTSSVELTNCTFANNYAGWVGGAVCSDKTTTKIKNCIFYQNTAGNGGNNWKIQQHGNDEFIDLGSNIQFPAKFTNNFNDFNVSKTVNLVDPKLGTIGGFGGFAPTIPILAGSPAIDKGTGCPNTDQRGANRVGNCDIGAFEFGSTITETYSEFAQPQTWNVFPNPANGALVNKIQLIKPQSKSNQRFTIKLCDIHGKSYLSSQIQEDENQFALDIENIASGIYLLFVENEFEKQQIKLSVIK